MKDIARIGFKAPEFVIIDSYARNGATESFILIDEVTHQIVADGMIV